MAVRASISQESLPSASERALRHHRLRSALGRGAGQTDCSVRVAPQVMDDSPRGAASWPSPSITRQRPPHVSSPSNQQPARNSHAWPPPENFLRLRRAGEIAPMGADTVPRGGARKKAGGRTCRSNKMRRATPCSESWATLASSQLRAVCAGAMRYGYARARAPRSRSRP